MTRKLCPGPVDVPVLQRPRAAACRGTVAATLGYADMRRCLGYYATAGSARSLSAVPVATAIYAQTGSTSWVAAVTVARLVPFLLVSWLAGFVADRLDRRRTLAVMALGQALLLLALAGALMLSFDPAVTLAIISVSTVLTTPLFPTLASSLPHIVDDEDMICASVVLNGVETLSWVIGPALGGALLVVFDPVTVVAIGAIISLAGGWSIPQLRPNPGGAMTGTPIDVAGTTSVLGGIRAIASRAEIVAPMLLVAVVNALNGAEGVGLVIVAEDVLGTGKEGFGLLTTVLGVGGILGLVASKRLATSRRRLPVLAGSAVLSGVPFGLLAVAGDQPVALVLAFMAGAFSVAAEVAALSIILESLPPSLIGRVFGIVDSMLVATMLLGAVSLPAIISMLGLRPGMLVFAIAGPALAAVLALWLPTIWPTSATIVTPDRAALGIELARAS